MRINNYDGFFRHFQGGTALGPRTEELKWIPAKPADPSMVGSNYTGTNYNIGGKVAKINWRDRTLTNYLWDFDNN